jgi:lipid A oxidase
MFIGFQLFKRASLLITLTTASLSPLASIAEISLGGYIGTAYTSDTDVQLSQPGGTDLTFSNVSWDDESFEEPIFWGVRLTWWLENSPQWGLALEFAHPKMVAKRDEVVHVSGVRAGTPVNTNEPLSNTFSHFEFTDGYNLLTVSGIHRWGHEHKKRYSFVPYVGAGAGIAIPYVETTIAGVETREYQVTGLALQVMAGSEFFLTNPFSLFIEYKFNYSDVSANLTGGGSIELEPFTHQFIFGAQWHFN